MNDFLLKLRQALSLRLTKCGQGVNLFGYFEKTSTNGVQTGGFSTAQILNHSHIPFQLFNISDFSRYGRLPFRMSIPFDINLFHVNADQTEFYFKRLNKNYYKNCFNIGYWFWELQSFPAIWNPAFSYLNEIWTASSFTQKSIQTRSPIPVRVVPPCISFETKPYHRSRLGLPEETFIFLFIFDFYSYFDRKNPLAVIQAFKNAFRTNNRVSLVIHCQNSHFDPENFKKLSAAADQKNIIVIDKKVAQDQARALITSSDCYVSLHRCEGFGFTIAEAMHQEKPVVVTNYSGNTDFTNDTNSFLVPYHLVQIEKTIGPYEKGGVWAEPDVKQASQILRDVYKNYDQACLRGKIARKTILEQYSLETIASIVSFQLNSIRVSKNQAHR